MQNSKNEVINNKKKGCRFRPGNALWTSLFFITVNMNVLKMSYLEPIFTSFLLASFPKKWVAVDSHALEVCKVSHPFRQ